MTKPRTPAPKLSAHWCRLVVQARVIAIEAPCRWSISGRMRPSERELMQRGTFCFASPTRYDNAQ